MMFVISDIRDLAAAHDLNEASIPHVSSVTGNEMSALAGQADYFKGIYDGDELAGFLLALGPGKNYASLNYRWFSEHYESFFYIDRIAIAEKFQGRGLGRMLYADVERFAAAPLITCEVNIRPPNPGSLAFHEKMGYREAGQQDTEGGDKRVSLLIKPLRAA